MATIRCRVHCFENIQAVLFDKDGTLANVEDYLTALGKARSHFIDAQVQGLQSPLLSAFGILEDGLNPAGLMAVGSRTDNKIAAAAYVAAKGYDWIAALDLVETAFQQAIATLPPKVTQTPPLAGVVSLLQRLKSTGVTLGIVSADAHSEVATFVAQYQLADISWYCGSAPEWMAKTDPAFLKFACESIGVDPSATLIIGDSAADLQLARQGAAGFLGMVGGWQRPHLISATVNAVDAAVCSGANSAVITFDKLSQVESFD